MRKPNSKNLVLGFLGLCTVLSIGGAVSSSLAWYAYATRAALIYSGTSVFDNGQLQIGVKSEVEISDLVADGMEEEIVNGSYYYFAPAGEGLSSEYLQTYLKARNYAAVELYPVTSGQYDPNDQNHNAHALLTPPSSENPHPNVTNNRASTMSYSFFTFAFKVYSTDNLGHKTFIPNCELWLTYVKTRASKTSSGNVSQSLRMYIQRDESNYGANNGFLFNPSSKTNGETKVGGLLNLGYDEYYDFDDNGEILYGDYSIKEGYNTTGISDGPYTGDDNIVDINNKWSWDIKENTEENRNAYADSFTAAHSPYAPKYFANLDNLDIKTAKYFGTDYVIQTKNSEGELVNPEGRKTSVCITGDENVNCIGEFDATIYLEGWDFSVVDQEQSHQFDFQLRFETNKAPSINNNNSSSNNG